VVDLPLPVGPVTRTIPLGFLDISLKIGGVFNSSKVNTLDGMVRKTAPIPRCCIKAFTRNLATFGKAKEKSHSKCSSKSFL